MAAYLFIRLAPRAAGDTASLCPGMVPTVTTRLDLLYALGHAFAVAFSLASFYFSLPVSVYLVGLAGLYGWEHTVLKTGPSCFSRS